MMGKAGGGNVLGHSWAVVACMCRPARLSSRSNIGPERAPPLASGIQYPCLLHHFLVVGFLSRTVWQRHGVLEHDAERHVLAHLQCGWLWCEGTLTSSPCRTIVGIGRMFGRCHLRSCWRSKKALLSAAGYAIAVEIGQSPFLSFELFECDESGGECP